MKEINLEEILESVQLENGATIESYISKEGNIYKIVKRAMKESCHQALDLAAENAEVLRTADEILADNLGYTRIGRLVDEQSILQIKDWIK